RLSAHGPGVPWPQQLDGTELLLPNLALEPNGRVTIELDATVTLDLENDPKFEGVLTLFDTRTQGAVERVDFMQWPNNSALARVPEKSGSFRFCTNTTPGEENTCDELLSRDVG